jgi:hypothetical protein
LELTCHALIQCLRGATVGDHAWKAIKRLVKLVTKEAGDKQLGIELGINFFDIHVCSNTSGVASGVHVGSSAPSPYASAPAL